MRRAANKAQRQSTYEHRTRQTPASTREQEFNEALERVYRIYGTDLSAFFRDVQREQKEQLVKRSEE
jgi:hypothetical protein